ncbi:MAG: peptidase C25 [Flavobacterium sp. BFFFF1]|uniref:type IX secretion system sortase PorU n=1 Tax=Flavobacterium sp. BFFFF1 TaxID=2015557 RepID=UPI000BC54097|nr:type IX secretion system sortase PorU [Flavobacterium sp. BFFFF1]OYU79546.1 MAG: peptidase C25 [Flavobacterium sp. BFFFF1]
MKKAVLIFLIFLPFGVTAQITGSFTLNWKDNVKVSTESSSYTIPQFQLENFNFDSSLRTVSLMLNIPAKAPVNESSLLITNAIYENISANQLGFLSSKALPSALNEKIMNVKARGELSLALTLSPVLNENGSFKRLKSFSYSINYSVGAGNSARNGFDNIAHSVLASGDWYRFYVEKSGVYKVSKTFLQSLGMKLNNVDPRKIAIYGNGGRMVPMKNSVDYPADPAENAIFFEGESDGIFDSQDYILFYAEGVDNWSPENQTNNNLYADKSYYYVTVLGANGKRISAMPAATGTVTAITEFDDYQFHELDETNVARLGRKWFGEDFSINNEYSFDFKFPNIVTSSPLDLAVSAVAVANAATSMEIAVNGTPAGNINFQSIVPLDLLGDNDTVNANAPASEDVTVKLTYNNNGVPTAKAFLDYITIKAKRSLVGYGKQFRFQYNAAATMNGSGEFKLTNASNISQVWDITDIYNVTAAVNDSQANFSFQADLGEIRKYIAVDKQDYFAPKKESKAKIANQDIKGTIFNNAQGQFQDIDYLIITPGSLHNAAEKLADFHRTFSGLNVKVVNVESLYPEFSSGKQDIGAIRNFVKYVYNNASADNKKVQYLNLFGDASYDFKDRIPNNTNLIPIYHALPSFSLSASYISDDFFVLMDDNEGDMTTVQARGLDIAVGRMPVKNSSEADQMVNKVIEYNDIKSFGQWRNNFVLISDDVDKSGEQELEEGLDDLGDQIFAQKPFINVKKIHSDSYVQETSAGGNRYPKVREDFISAFEQGALVFNYFGHGGEEGLAHERILEKKDVQNFGNRYKYPLFVTITCEFTRFDNPYRPTAGEYMFLNPAGGSIALVTTTRQISIGTGQAINLAFSGNLYGFNSNSPVSIAEALRISKSQFGSNPLMVFYIGDPAVRLAIPKPKIVLTKVNGMPITGTVDDFKALSNIRIAGEVRDENGNNILSDYNGDLAVNVFDKPISIQTLGNDGVTDNSGNVIKMNFINLGETIFRGNASVTNGNFEFSFIVPRDIRVPLDYGRVSFYAKKTGQLIDQTGYNTDIKVGGINPNPPADEIAPRVKLYMNDETFVSGGITNESPFLLAFLEDENGINTASGIGHDITAILDGDESKPYILNDYYEAASDDYTKGKLRFPFRNLEKGLHVLTFTAWDVYNNPVTAEIQFVVVGDETLTLKNVLNYPNPFVNYTEFWFTHNRPFEPLEVQVQVMTITGKVVWTKNQTVTNDGFLSRDIKWDGKDDFGDKIGKGVYVYKLTVKSTLTNRKTEKIEKLVIL